MQTVIMLESYSSCLAILAQSKLRFAKPHVTIAARGSRALFPRGWRLRHSGLPTAYPCPPQRLHGGCTVSRRHTAVDRAPPNATEAVAVTRHASEWIVS